MILTDFSLCNRALDLLGGEPISDLAEDSRAARLCARNYPLVRDTILSGTPWNSAIRRASLPVSAGADAVLPDGRQRFPLPNDCLRVWRVETGGLGWSIENGAIIADSAAPLEIAYLARPQTPSGLDMALVEAIISRLAADLAYPLTGSTSLANEMDARAKARLAEARRIDAVQADMPGQEPGISSWLTAR